MGQTISNLIDSLEDKAAKEKLANDAMNSLIELAKMQEEAFMLQISNPNFQTKMIPIDQIIEKNKVIRADFSASPGPISDTITDTFSAFASGDVAKGITTLVSNGIKALVGEYSGSTSMRDYYLISTGSMGGVFRIDLHLYAYRYTSEQLTAVSKGIILVSMVMSAVDISQIKDNTLRVIVQNTYGGSTIEEQEKMYQQLLQSKNNDNKPSITQMRHQAKFVSHKLNREHRVTPRFGSHERGTITQQFRTRFTMGQANRSAAALEAYLSGAVGAKLGPTNHVSSIACSCVQADNSTSDTELTGSVITEFKDIKSEAQFDEFIDIFKKAVKEALDLAQNTDLVKFDLTSFVLEEPTID